MAWFLKRFQYWRPCACSACPAPHDIIHSGEDVKTQRLPSFWIFFWLSLFFLLAGWGGLAYLVFQTLPYLAPRWLFFFFLMLALTGLAIPVAYFFNRRFPSNPPVESAVVVRESMWVGIYGCAIAWLQLGRVLTPGIVVLLAAGFISIEALLRLRERSQWPVQAEEEEVPEDEDEEEDD